MASNASGVASRRAPPTSTTRPASSPGSARSDGSIAPCDASASRSAAIRAAFALAGCRTSQPRGPRRARASASCARIHVAAAASSSQRRARAARRSGHAVASTSSERTESSWRFELWGLLSPAAAEWSFYVVVALFKTLLELWFGVFDRIRSAAGGASAMRWFVLGGASAFDAALAAARGLLLAEQGMGGSAVTVSNIVFVGFGVAVPWVAAHTGGLLVAGMDGFLARLGLLRWLAALPRVLLLTTLWLMVVALALPVLATVLALGLVALVWFALDDVVATILGHEDDATPDLPIELLRVAREASPPSPPRDPPLALPRVAGGVP